jgi:hypothetical protein
VTEIQPIICSKTSPPVVCSCKGSFTIEEAELLKKIKTITARGNDVEIRPKRDGKLAVYEIKKKSV